MKVIELGSTVDVSVVLRATPNIADDLVLKLRNETSNVRLEEAITWYTHKDRVVFTFDPIPSDFKAGNKYEIEIYNNTTSQIVYRGKLLIVKAGTDIQNYTPSKQHTRRYKTKA